MFESVELLNCKIQLHNFNAYFFLPWWDSNYSKVCFFHPTRKNHDRSYSTPKTLTLEQPQIWDKACKRIGKMHCYHHLVRGCWGLATASFFSICMRVLLICNTKMSVSWWVLVRFWVFKNPYESYCVLGMSLACPGHVQVMSEAPSHSLLMHFFPIFFNFFFNSVC